ncbi:MAG: DUF4867 family protein [Lachnospiraceae bacterium]|nr:DUF4867 family protein [Lachnospiraceae bacterium]
MKIQNVNDAAFREYGRVVKGFDFTEFLKVLTETTEAPDHVIYVASDANLEALAVAKQLQDNCYGGLPIEIGYCNGTNTKLNCLEYHKDSEINIAADDAVLLVARLQDAADGPVDSSKVEAFMLPAGTAVELYATTMHYAPCSGKKGAPFRVAIVLPKGTNGEKPDIVCKNDEDRRLFARNKWLIAHPDTDEAKQGAVIGITGENVDIADLI